MTVVVLEPFKLGDFIQSTALLAELRRSYPNQGLFLVASRPEVIAAADHTGLADETILLSEAQWAQGSSAKIPSCQLLVNLSSSPQALNVAQNIEAKEVLGPVKDEVLGGAILPPPQKLARAVMLVDRRLGRFNLVDLWRLLSPAGPGAIRRLRWPLWGPKENGDQDAAWPEEFRALLSARGESTGQGELGVSHKGSWARARPLVGFHMGSGHHLRRWPTEYFCEAYKLIGHCDLVLLGGPAERALAKRFMAILGDRAHSVTDLSGRTSLATLGRVLAKLDLLVSADTGVIHMAAAVDTPIVAAFGGPALAGETGPYSRKATIIQGYGPCSPCREGPNCRLSVCPYLPGPGPIAWAARSILGLPRLESHEESFKDEGFHRTYRPIYDAFGQNLVVDSSFESTTDYDFADEEDLAMAIRTAGIAALKLDQYHQTLAAQGLDKKDGQALKVSQNPSGAHRLMETVRSIADLAFSDLETKRRFVLTADAILFARQN